MGTHTIQTVTLELPDKLRCECEPPHRTRVFEALHTERKLGKQLSDIFSARVHMDVLCFFEPKSSVNKATFDKTSTRTLFIASIYSTPYVALSSASASASHPPPSVSATSNPRSDCLTLPGH